MAMEQRMGKIDAVEHWRKIREHPDFGKGYLNIKPQPLAHERVKFLEARLVELEKELRERTSID